MKRVCAWCGSDLGETAPLNDERVTHGICDRCLREQERELERQAAEKRQ